MYTIIIVYILVVTAGMYSLHLGCTVYVAVHIVVDFHAVGVREDVDGGGHEAALALLAGSWLLFHRRAALLLRRPVAQIMVVLPQPVPELSVRVLVENVINLRGKGRRAGDSGGGARDRWRPAAGSTQSCCRRGLRQVQDLVVGYLRCIGVGRALHHRVKLVA